MQYRISEGRAILCDHEKDRMDIVEILEDTSEDVFLKHNNFYSPITEERPESHIRYVTVTYEEMSELLKHDVHIHNLNENRINAVIKGNKVFGLDNRYFDKRTSIDILASKSISNDTILSMAIELDNKLNEVMQLRARLDAANKPITVYKIEMDGWELTYNENGKCVIISPDNKIMTMGDDLKYIIFTGLAKSKRVLIRRGFQRFIKEKEDENS